MSDDFQELEDICRSHDGEAVEALYRFRDAAERGAFLGGLGIGLASGLMLALLLHFGMRLF